MNDDRSTGDHNVRRLSAFVIAAVLLIAAGIMSIPLTKQSATSGASSTPPSTTGIAPKPSKAPAGR